MSDVSPHTILLKEVDFRAPVLPETRAVRLPPQAYADREDLDHVLENMARAGFNLIVADVLVEGRTVYPSQVARACNLPRSHVGRRQRDVVDYLCDHAARFGIAIYAGLDVLAAGRRRHFGRRTLGRCRPGWLVRTRSGACTHRHGPEPDSLYLCPTNPEVRRYLGDLLYELAESYPVEGFFLDALRFPLRSSFPDTALCMCETCRAAVARDLGFDLEKIPMHVSDPDFQRWTQWKGEQITQLLYSLRTRVRKARWSIRLVGAVHRTFGSGMFAHDVVCDWPAWTCGNMVDAVCPTPVGTDPELFAAAVRDDIAVLAPGTLYLAQLPVSDMSSGCALLTACRHSGANGFVYQCPDTPTEAELAGVATHLARGALPAEDNPIASAVYYMKQIGSVAAEGSQLREEASGAFSLLASSDDIALDKLEQLLRTFDRLREETFRQGGSEDLQTGLSQLVRFLQASLLL